MRTANGAARSGIFRAKDDGAHEKLERWSLMDAAHMWAIGYSAQITALGVCMSSDLLIALIGFAIVSSISPGPNNLLVMTSGLNYGVPRSLPLVTGITLGFVVMLIAIGIGLGPMIQSSSWVHTGVKILGLAYMLWLAWKVAVSDATPAALDNDACGRPLSALDGAAFQWVNPKAWAVALSATAVFTVPDTATGSLALISLVFTAVAFVCLSAWAAFGTFMRRLVDTPSKTRVFNVAMALLLVASAAPVAYDLIQAV